MLSLPNEIFCEILELLAGPERLRLMRVNKHFYANINKARYDYIRDHFTTNIEQFRHVKFTAHVCTGLLRCITQSLQYKSCRHIYLYHVYLPISISIAITYGQDDWPDDAVYYMWIGKSEEFMRLGIKYERFIGRPDDRCVIKFIWPKQVKYRPYHTRILTFMKEYLPEVYGFTTTEHKITGAETND